MSVWLLNKNGNLEHQNDTKRLKTVLLQQLAEIAVLKALSDNSLRLVYQSNNVDLIIGKWQYDFPIVVNSHLNVDHWNIVDDNIIELHAT